MFAKKKNAKAKTKTKNDIKKKPENGDNHRSASRGTRTKQTCDRVSGPNYRWCNYLCIKKPGRHCHAHSQRADVSLISCQRFLRVDICVTNSGGVVSSLVLHLLHIWVRTFLLPPASEGWGKVIFSVCPHLGGRGGYPIPGLGGGTLSQVCVWGGGVLHPRSGWGVPCPRSGWGGTLSQVWVGGTLSKVWMGGYPIPGLCGGLPHPRSGWGGTLSEVWMREYPIPGLCGGTLSQVCVGGKPRVPPPPPGLDGVLPTH